jgi:hypothetical protein
LVAWLERYSKRWELRRDRREANEAAHVAHLEGLAAEERARQVARHKLGYQPERLGWPDTEDNPREGVTLAAGSALSPAPSGQPGCPLCGQVGVELDGDGLLRDHRRWVSRRRVKCEGSGWDPDGLARFVPQDLSKNP